MADEVASLRRTFDEESSTFPSLQTQGREQRERNSSVKTLVFTATVFASSFVILRTLKRFSLGYVPGKAEQGEEEDPLFQPF